MRVVASYPVCRRLPPPRRLVTLEQTDFCPRPFSEGLPGQLLLSAHLGGSKGSVTGGRGEQSVGARCIPQLLFVSHVFILKGLLC